MKTRMARSIALRLLDRLMRSERHRGQQRAIPGTASQIVPKRTGKYEYLLSPIPV